MKYILYIYAMILTAMLAACSHDAEDVIVEEEGIELPVYITIPATTTATTRVPGDPVTSVTYPLPTHIRLYVCTSKTSGGTLNEDDRNSATEVKTVTLDDIPASAWETLTNDNDDLGNSYVTLYRYKGGITVILPKDIAWGKVYAVAYAEEKNASGENDASHPGFETVFPGATTPPTSCAAVRQLTYTFTKAGDGVNAYLRNLYSTPIFNPTGKTFAGAEPTEIAKGSADGFADHAVTTLEQMNGVFRDPETKRPSANVVLYHVASQLDVTWNTEQDAEGTITGKPVKQLTVSAPISGTCPIFGVGGTKHGGSNGSSFEETITTTIGTQWNGRHVMFVPHYSPVTFSYQRDGSSNTANAVDNTDTPYSIWYRIQATIK